MKYFFVLIFSILAQFSFAQENQDSQIQYVYFSQQASEKFGSHVLLLKNGDTLYYTVMSHSSDLNEVKSSYQWNDTVFIQAIKPGEIVKYDLINYHLNQNFSFDNNLIIMKKY